MEEEADRLGVPWTHATTDEQLHSLIQSRLRGEPMANGSEDPTVTHECLGLFWDFPKEDACKECSGQQKCFQQFCATTLPEMQAKLGPGATLPQLAKALDVSQEAVLVAMNQQSKAAPAPAPEPEPEELEEEVVEEESEPEDESEEELEEELDEEPEEEELEDADELEDELEEPEPEEVEEDEPPAEPDPEPEPPSETEMAAKKKTTKKKTTKKKTTKKKAVVKKAPAKKTAAKKTAAKKAPAKKKKKAAKKAPPAVTSEVQDPTQAESAQTATGSAKSKARGKSASRAKGQADPAKSGGGSKGSKVRKAKPKKKPAKKPAKKAATKSRVAHVEDPWGEHTWDKRYQRERKNKWVAKLRPGMKLKREYKGETYEVLVLKKFYKFRGQVYPTGYSITKEITGTKEAPRQLDKNGNRPQGTRQLCNWSFVKFFNLKALTSKR